MISSTIKVIMKRQFHLTMKMFHSAKSIVPICMDPPTSIWISSVAHHLELILLMLLNIGFSNQVLTLMSNHKNNKFH
jgi:pentose-5-phosphate-3-epimerase